VLAFYVVLLGAGSQDVFAQHLDASITTVDLTFRIMLLVAPVVTAAIAWKWCHDLSRESPPAPEPDAREGSADRGEPGSGRRESRLRRVVHALERIGAVAVVGAAIADAVHQRAKDHGS